MLYIQHKFISMKKVFYIIWRSWFYMMMGLPLIVLFPILFIATSRAEWYPFFFKIVRLWAKWVLYTTGFIPIRKDGIFLEKGRSFMIVANHTSMLDVMLMLHTIKNPFVFVGKKELVKIPIFGFFYKRSCILVDRNSPRSRKEVYDQCQERISQGLSICIFPEGGVPDDESIILDDFKDGAFRMAIEHQLPILPLVFPDNKKRFSYTFFSGSLGKTRSYILPIIPTTELQLENKGILKSEVHSTILEKLKATLPQ